MNEQNAATIANIALDNAAVAYADARRAYDAAPVGDDFTAFNLDLAAAAYAEAFSIANAAKVDDDAE